MRDFLVSNLEHTYQKVTPITQRIFQEILSNYILVENEDKKGVVLLVDREYPKDSLSRVYRYLRAYFLTNVASVLIKDGETFFRSAMEKNYFKKERKLSLKNYSDKDLQRMILFRPEESFLFYIQKKKIQYFQPNSERLTKGLETFLFKEVIFDYSHIDKYNTSLYYRNVYGSTIYGDSAIYKFRPYDGPSKKLYIWIEREHYSGGGLEFKGFLLSKKSVETSLYRYQNNLPLFGK